MELSPDSATADASGEIPEHGIRTGDLVAVAEQPAGSARKRDLKGLEAKGSRGVVTRVGLNAIWVALDGEDDDAVVAAKRLWVVKLDNDVTYKRYVSLLPLIFEEQVLMWLDDQYESDDDSSVEDEGGRIFWLFESAVWSDESQSGG